MATATQVLVEEYLESVYEPECEYLDGDLVPRNIGLLDHSLAQRALLFSLASREKELGILVLPSQTIKLSPTRYLIPDLVILQGSEPDEQILTAPPLVCIEVLSIEDRTGPVLRKIAAYLDFGVRYVWILDTTARQALVFTAEGMAIAGQSLRAEHIEVPLNEIFD